MAKKPNVELVDITPEMALDWLTTQNKNFRRISEKRVQILAKAIDRGEWELNGETIKFNGKNILVDGQHRLSAISRSGKTVQSLVVRNLGTEGYTTVDMGRPKSVGDWLRFNKEKNVSCLASCMRMLYFHENGILDQTRNTDAQPTVAQLLNVLERNPDLRGAAKAHCQKGDSFLPKNLLTFLFYVVSQASESEEEDASIDEFFEKLVTGEGVCKTDQTSPIFLLRGRLIKNFNSTIGKLNTIEKLALVIKSWNAWAKGSIMKNLVYKPSIEEFPKIQGFSV